MTLIKTKQQYLKLAQAGLVGNCPKTWSTVEEFLRESQAQIVGIRCLTPGSNKFRAFVSRDRVQVELDSLQLSKGDFYLSTTIPVEDIILAGELTWCQGDWYFYHSFTQLPMREALAASGRHAVGYQAVWGLLGKYATPEDLSDLHTLFEQYSPNHQYPVIELTVTRHDWGIYSRRNILIWEVRHF